VEKNKNFNVKDLCEILLHETKKAEGDIARYERFFARAREHAGRIRSPEKKKRLLAICETLEPLLHELKNMAAVNREGIEQLKAEGNPKTEKPEFLN